MEVSIEVAQAREAHVGLVALPERGRGHGHFVGRAAAVWQAFRHAAHHKLVRLGRVKRLQEPVPFNRLAKWHPLISGWKVPRDAPVVVDRPAEVRQALHPAVFDGVGLEQLKIVLVVVVAFPLRDWKRPQTVLRCRVCSRQGHVALVARLQQEAISGNDWELILAFDCSLVPTQ